MNLPDGLTLYFTDSHNHKNSLEELAFVFEEIYDLAVKYRPEYIVCGGDYNDDSTMTPEVLTFSTVWAKKFASVCKVFIMLTGNHPSVKSGETSVDYLRWVQGLIQVTEEIVIGNTLYGHFATEKSQMCYNGILTGNKYERHTDELKQYDLVVLGHQHWFQEIEPNIVHMSSCRYVTFGEVDAKGKFAALIQNNKIEYIPLTKVYPMVDIRTLEEAEAIQNPLFTKVRFVVDDFKYLKDNLNAIEALKTKFFRFKRKLNFVDVVPTKEKLQQYQKKSLQFQVYTWIENIKDKEVANILMEELKDGYYVS